MSLGWFARAPSPHPPGPVGPLQGPPWGWVLSPSKRARLRSHFLKVRQNGQVSPKYHEKASRSPYSQNGSRKSALEILRFPLWPAFSCKELMGHFDRYSDFYVKMTKCRPVVHTQMYAKWSPDTPTVHVSKLTPVHRSSSGSARAELTLFLTFSTRSFTLRN